MKDFCRLSCLYFCVSCAFSRLKNPCENRRLSRIAVQRKNKFRKESFDFGVHPVGGQIFGGLDRDFLLVEVLCSLAAIPIAGFRVMRSSRGGPQKRGRFDLIGIRLWVKRLRQNSRTMRLLTRHRNQHVYGGLSRRPLDVLIINRLEGVLSEVR